MWVYFFAGLAALLFALGSVVQQRAASAAPPEKALSFGLLLWLVRRRMWVAGVVVSIVGNLFAAVAIGEGGVALAQPLFTARLVFALAITAVIARVRIPRRDWLAALMTAGGLAAFVAVGHPHRGHPLAASTSAWVPVVVGIAVVVAVLVGFARRQHVSVAAFVLGAAAGLLFGLQSSLTEVSISQLKHYGTGAVTAHWQPWLLVAVAVYGAVLIQSAYEMAPLPASFPALVTVEPLTGLMIGVTILEETLHVWPAALVAEVGGLVVMVGGVGVLARSPLVTGQLAALERRRDEGLAYQTALQLERLLSETESAVGHYWRLVGVRHSEEESERHVRTAGRQLARLDGLLADMNRLKGEEVRLLRDLPTKERMMLAPLEQELDDRQERIEAWAERLRADFERLCRHRDER